RNAGRSARRAGNRPRRRAEVAERRWVSSVSRTLSIRYRCNNFQKHRFLQRMQEMRTEMFSQAAGRFSGPLGKAAQKIGELLHSDSESTRLAAASRILEYCPKTLEDAPVVAQRPAGPDYGALALADPVAAQLVVQLLSRAARQPAQVECVVQPKSAVTADLA